MYLKPYINYWDQAIALMMHPLNWRDSLSRLLAFANELLIYAGDDAAQGDWYVERGKLVM